MRFLEKSMLFQTFNKFYLGQYYTQEVIIGILKKLFIISKESLENDFEFGFELSKCLYSSY